jgi:hypothetical protein
VLTRIAWTSSAGSTHQLPRVASTKGAAQHQQREVGQGPASAPALFERAYSRFSNGCRHDPHLAGALAGLNEGGHPGIVNARRRHSRSLFHARHSADAARRRTARCVAHRMR